MSLKTNPHSVKMQRGLTLIEALIALLVISIGLLGIAALQLTSLKQTSNANWSSQAVWYSYEMTDRINANRSDDNVSLNNYIGIDTNDDYNQDCVANPCSPADMATADAEQWKALISNLPEGRGVINAGPVPNSLEISVLWRDSVSDPSAAADTEDLVTNCPDDIDDTDGMICYTVTFM